ncbi:MAG: undecaprenyldiphospho-muramoylpentapeptide beta-N-acetylglucosaminyltransferase [Deltaproteobacteria bacterium]|jgi:UDP-N-acetylglucosamine--N-acetylmuramyl-(pentapeptide) pyrophosphoryl-undecaprenol N-acetylglucosamine transferase|nr:undecaprenyldiphospho-muramoylpentapeptide beta-N-acetylglucosaminyltransferase [Deltaproteobacteria bacterium]
MPSEAVRVLIAAGGTGGHIMPAVAAAEAINALAEARFLFVGTGRPAEAAILGPLGYKRERLDVIGLKGKGILGLPKALWKAFLAIIKSISLIRSFKPDLCLVTGGYVCGPVGVAAFMSGTPLVLHEQNSRPGLTNRWLSRLAKLVFLGFREAASSFDAAKVRVVGNPVRAEIEALSGSERDFQAKPSVILILGGSQGAKSLNQAALELARVLKQKGTAISFIHQTGESELLEVEKAYRELGVEATVKAFFSDMVWVYKTAHLAISRAGALTIAELCACRLPSVLVPLPTAADDHQTINALSLVDAGIARLVKQQDLHKGALIETAAKLLENPAELAQMSKKAKSIAKTDSATVMAKTSLELIGKRQGDIDRH